MNGLLVRTALVVAVAVFFAPSAVADVLGYPFCDSLRDLESKTACMEYVNSVSSVARWTSAVRWARFYKGSYQCANVTALCLLNDMYAERYGSTCIPAATNSPCEMDAGGHGTCWQGMCISADEAAVNMLLAKDGFMKPYRQQQAQQLWQQWQLQQQSQQLQQQRQQQPAPLQVQMQQQAPSQLQQPQVRQQPQQQLLLQPNQAAAGLTQPAANLRLAQTQQQQQQQRQTAAAMDESLLATLMQNEAPTPPISSVTGADNYEYDDALNPSASSQAPGSGSAGSTDSSSTADGAATGLDTKQKNKKPEFQLDPNDPYGLTIDLGKNSKINDPFAPPAPPPPPPSPSPKPPPPEPRRGQLTIDIQPDAFIQAVPPSFIGVSREWTPFVWYDENLEAFERVFAQLGPSPILRIGGATQEGLIKLPDAKFMDALVRLHCSLGIRYIIGLPLFQNAPQLPLAFKALFDATFKNYPFAIVSYELGNEPNYWPTKAGGFTTVNGGTTCTPVQLNNPAYQLVGSLDVPADRENEGYALYRDAAEPYLPYKPQSYCFTPQTTVFAAGVENYNTYFARAANALTGCNGLTQDFQANWGWPYWGPPGFNRKVLSGPAWGDFTKDISAFRIFLANSNQCYLNEATFHYYGPNRNTTFERLFNKLTAPDPNQQNKALIGIVKDFINAARTSNITLRVSEANSVPDGGQSSFSNTIGAAIWTLVTAMEFAQAGASGINFHWGDGGSPPGVGRAPAYVGVQTGFRNDTVRTPYPLVRVPFYGYVMYSRAFGNNGPGIFLNYSSDAVVSACRELFYTYAVLVPHAGMISVIAANANPNVTCDVTATLPGVSTTSASLQLLSGPRGNLSAFEGVSLAGQTYQGQDDGRMKGRFTPILVQPHMHSIRTTGWTFNVPPASAALLQIPLIGGATPGVGVDTETPDLVGGGTQDAVDPFTAAWTPPVAVPFPPVPGFEQPEDDRIPGMKSADDVSADNTDTVVGDGSGTDTEPTGPTDAVVPGSGNGVDRSGLFEYDATALKSRANLQPAQQPSQAPPVAAAPAPVPVTAPKAGQPAAPAAPPAQPAGEYILKGFTADRRPVYTWRAADSSGRTYKQQTPPQQVATRRVEALESGTVQLQQQPAAAPHTPTPLLQHVSQWQPLPQGQVRVQQQQQQQQQSVGAQGGVLRGSILTGKGKGKGLSSRQVSSTQLSAGQTASSTTLPSGQVSEVWLGHSAATPSQPGRANTGSSITSRPGGVQAQLRPQQQSIAGATATVRGARRGLLGLFAGLKRLHRPVSSKFRTGSSVSTAGVGSVAPAAAAWGPAMAADGSAALQYSATTPGLMSGTGMGMMGGGTPVLEGGSMGSLGGMASVGSMTRASNTAVGGSFGALGNAAVGGVAGNAGTALAQGASGMATSGNFGGGGGGGGGPLLAGSGSAGAQASGSASVGVGVDVSADLSAGDGRVLVPQYQNPNYNFIPPRTAGVGPSTRPVPQSAGAEFTPNGPIGVGLVWPTPSNPSPLNVGVPGLGGYQLLPPGFDEEAIKRAAEVCPGIDRIYQIQSRAGTS